MAGRGREGLGADKDGVQGLRPGLRGPGAAPGNNNNNNNNNNNKRQNDKAMTKEEFQKITRVEVGSTEWDAIEELYMRADVDWNTFIHAWKRMVPIRWAQGRNGRRKMEVEQQRRLLVESVWDDARPALMLNRDEDVCRVLDTAVSARLLRAGFPVDGKAGALLDRLAEFLNEEASHEG